LKSFVCFGREIEKTAIRFYGHPGIKAAVKAICQVENGPVYELYLHGQASYMAYRLNTHKIDFGDIYFDKITTRTVTLNNVGSVPLDFHFLNFNDQQNDGRIDVEPESGVCAPFTSTVLTIKYLPNIPETFERILFLQIAHFQPDEIHLIGTGMFSRLELDLPRFIPSNSTEEKIYDDVQKQADEHDQQEQFDKRIIQNYVQKSNEVNTELFESNLAQQASVRSSQTSLTSSVVTSITKRSLIDKSTPILPDYLLDFEHVILGTVRQHTIQIRNPTKNNITFQIDRLAYKNTGFSFDCDHVKNLPAGETITITVTFDPRGANLELGPIEYRIPVEVNKYKI